MSRPLPDTLAKQQSWLEGNDKAGMERHGSEGSSWNEAGTAETASNVQDTVDVGVNLKARSLLLTSRLGMAMKRQELATSRV